MRDSRARDHPTSRTGTDGAVKTAYRNGSRRQDRVQEPRNRPRLRDCPCAHGVRAPAGKGPARPVQSTASGRAGRPRLRSGGGRAGRPRLRAAGRPRLRAAGRSRLRAAGRSRLRSAGRPAAATVVPRGDRGPARSSLGSVGKTRGPRGASASAESLTPRPTGWPWSKRAGQRPPPAKAAPEGRAGTLAEAAGAPGTFTGTAKAAGIRRLAAKGAKGFRRDMAWLDGGEARGCRARPESGGDVGACWGKVMP
jgi:hypothetical protein